MSGLNAYLSITKEQPLTIVNPISRPPKTEWYVQRRKRGKWAVIKNGHKRATYICATDKEAIELADSLSKGKLYRGCRVDVCDPSGNVVRGRTTFKQVEESGEDV